MSEQLMCKDCRPRIEYDLSNGPVILCPLHAQAAQWRELAEQFSNVMCADVQLLNSAGFSTAIEEALLVKARSLGLKVGEE